MTYLEILSSRYAFIVKKIPTTIASAVTREELVTALSCVSGASILNKPSKIAAQPVTVINVGH
jgi:hypothetical protein